VWFGCIVSVIAETFIGVSEQTRGAVIVGGLAITPVFSYAHHSRANPLRATLLQGMPA
jgi:hypothetical protein